MEYIELFVPSLTEAYLEHKVVLVNAMGTGADGDKLVFLWVPDMIKAYLGEEAILEQARSYDLRSAENRQYVLQNLDSLVLKTRQGCGGLGVFIMPDLDKGYRSRLARQLIEQPQVFIAQETLDFSRHLVFDEISGEFEERHVDLRVFAVQNGRGMSPSSPAASPACPRRTAGSPTTRQEDHANRAGWSDNSRDDPGALCLRGSLFLH